MSMTRSSTLTRAGLLFGGLLLVASGCSSSGGGGALSKDDFVKQGNAICDAGNKEMSAAEREFEGANSSASPDAAAIKAFFKDKFIPTIARQIDGLDKLKPPKDLEAAVDKLVKDARAAIDKVKAQADADPEKVFGGNEDPFADASKQAVAVGLTSCGPDSSDSGSSDSSS